MVWATFARDEKVICGLRSNSCIAHLGREKARYRTRLLMLFNIKRSRWALRLPNSLLLLVKYTDWLVSSQLATCTALSYGRF